VNEGARSGRVEGAGAEGFGDVGGSREAVDPDGQIAERGHEVGAWPVSSPGGGLLPLAVS